MNIKGYDERSPYAIDAQLSVASEGQENYTTIPQMEKAVSQTKRQMEKAQETSILWKQQD